MTYDFNLTDSEKYKVEDAISAIQRMIIYVGDDFFHLAIDILELIYGEERAEEIQNFIEEDLEEENSIMKEYKDGEFFIIHQDVEIIRELFTKK